ncbi:hypothetical protein FOCC_FOCC013734 [Frankliniella occidentalis]|nr:hypothetical protein FOCC_FOCC013734 [Frankliniella occidentalis]
MAQPLDNVPAFCLCIFGSNSIFTASQVLDRVWAHQQLRKRRPKNIIPEWKDFFYASMDNNTKRLTDCIHTVAKLRNQLLKPRTEDNFWPIGQYVISGSFLHVLLAEKNKSHLQLVPSD